jgi:hypothetical protein
VQDKKNVISHVNLRRLRIKDEEGKGGDRRRKEAISAFRTRDIYVLPCLFRLASSSHKQESISASVCPPPALMRSEKTVSRYNRKIGDCGQFQMWKNQMEERGGRFYAGTACSAVEPTPMKPRRALLLSLTVVLALCAACGLWLHREQRQYALNRQLIDALEHGDTKQALALVNAGADPNTRQFSTPAPTLPELLKQLLHHTPPPDNNSPTAFRMAFGAYWSTTPNQSFHLISLDENLPLIQAILAHGANVNARDSSNLTVLHDAVAYDQLHTVELLLQHGADINVQDTTREIPTLPDDRE